MWTRWNLLTLWKGGLYDWAIMNKIKQNFHISLDNWEHQWKQIQEKLSFISLTRVEAGEQGKLLHNLDISMIHLNHSFYYLQTANDKFQNLIMSLWHLTARIPTLDPCLSWLQLDVNNVYNYVETLSTYTLTPVLISPFSLLQ